MTEFLNIVEGDAPLVLSQPHSGQALTPGLAERMTDAGRSVIDTDWWVDRLYDFHDTLGASLVRTRLSRYVIDPNRDPSGASLYPGQATTGLCPTVTFDGAPLYLDGAEPDAAEIEDRKTRYFEPYHAALESLLARAVARHGFVLLYDCHSIRSEVPRLFEGRLPDFNIGTNGGQSCDPSLAQLALESCQAAEGYSAVLNGRFKGGWITRHYGRPDENRHAIQMELAQCAYMDEAPPWRYDEAKAARLAAELRRLLERLVDWSRANLGEAA